MIEACERGVKFLMWLIERINQNQGILTIVLLFLGYFIWLKRHQKERKSNFYFNIHEQIVSLRYLILELRQPRFLPKDFTSKDYVEKEIIPSINKVISQSYAIQKKLSTHDEIMKDKSKKITKIYRDKITKEIIKEISGAIHECLLDIGDMKLKEIIFPSEQTSKDFEYEQDETGLNIINDDFNKKIKNNFAEMIGVVEKYII